jgi:hypothetical protein
MKVVAILFAALLGASPALAGALFRCDWIEINDANKMCKDKNVNGYVVCPPSSSFVDNFLSKGVTNMIKL